MNLATRLAAVRFEPGPLSTPCHVWTRSLTNDGYGRIWADGRSRLTQCVAFELYVGPIPVGLTLDHLCRNRACCNARHLDPVTQQVNLSRGIHFNAVKTVCKHGHPFTEANTYVRPDGGRKCRACDRDWHAAVERLAVAA